ncbi:MAG: hypothetical protein HZC37_04260 [Burkholderiales bacterium]|nr:hypothetical protein [Burkholderiales bacterium]
MNHHIPADTPANVPAVARIPRPRLVPWLALAAATLLSACGTAPTYQPFEGGDAARLRVRLLIPADYRPFLLGYDFRSTVGVQSVKGTACSVPATAPMLRLYRGATSTPAVAGPQATPGTVMTTPPPPSYKYPRAGMPGATEGENTESVELKLAPGLHVVNLSWLRTRGSGAGVLLNALLTKNCPATNVALQLPPNAQVELAVGFKESECTWEARRLEGSAFVPTKVLKEGGPAEICAGNQFRQ